MSDADGSDLRGGGVADGTHAPSQRQRSFLDAVVASRYARAGLANISREYPNHPGHLLTSEEDLFAPSALHPIFFGSYDWHSSVHQHWMLVRLLRLHPDLPETAEVRATFDSRFDGEAACVEAAYFHHPERRSFERPYGWAWLLTLTAELHAWDDEAAARWAAALHPLAAVIRARCLTWLDATVYPHRVGTHANSAFACGLLHDAASAVGDDELLAAVSGAATRWYERDAGYPAWIEPSAADFLSPTLVEADLMRRVMDGQAFPVWFERFVPDVTTLTEPVVVADRTDPQGVHLDGLNLSRAWCWRQVAAALPADHPLQDAAATAVTRHTEASLDAVLTGEYVGEHWLPTFAVYLLSGALTSPDQPAS